MIKKARKIPLKISKLEALLRRLPKFHPKRSQIEGELGRRQAGFRGEQSLDYYLKAIRQKSYFIFHDLRLSDNDFYFQIDTLLITPYFCVIFEVKNISGTLHFDELHHQLIRTINEQVDCFADPILQVTYQQAHFQNWLENHKFPQIPIVPQVVISNPTSIIKATSKINVIHSLTLPLKIEEIQRKFRTEKLTLKDLRKLTSLILKNHEPPNANILENYKIKEEELLKGIHCPNCFAIPMIRYKKRWQCNSCQFISKNVYVQTLQDYALLIDFTITNKKFREFLLISSRITATKILHSLNLSQTGKTKGIKYIISIDEKE